jgi:cytoskeletal protein CcmA (bactofilin family)
MNDVSSERGIALVVVLLMMMVLTGLATGFAMTGQVEAQMGTNEVYYAGARAAAEAGFNRALVAVFADTATNWIAGTDGAVDAANANAAVNADNGSLSFLLGGAGPFYVDSNNKYSYTVQILDDDDNQLYETPLNAQQLAAMGEDGSAYTNTNERVVLRATGYGPNGTTIKLARIIESSETPHYTSTTTTTLSNPALLVNGNLEMDGAITIDGTSGNVHANGNLTKTGNGSGLVTGNATASGLANVGTWTATGTTGGGRPTVNVPSVNAADYMGIADYKLTSAGTVQTLVSGTWTNCTTTACKGIDWTYSGGTWSSGGTPSDATYYVEGNVDIGPTNGNSNRAISVIATGDINVHGSAELTPENAQKIQFVCNGDLNIQGAVDLNDPTTVEGQIMVRGQFDAGGNMEFQGRVLVQDVANVGNLVTANAIHGGVHFTYNGTLGAISTTNITTVTGAPTYVNNVSGWMEQ